jgi:hypothetical protein
MLSYVRDKNASIFNPLFNRLYFFGYFNQFGQTLHRQNCACNGMIISSAAVNELIVKIPKMVDYQ